MTWHVVNITSGFEQKIKNTIETTDLLRGVKKKVLVPIVKKSRFYKDKLYNYAEKLYPGYVFVACDDSDYEDVFSTISIIPGILNMSSINGVRKIEFKVDDDEMMWVLEEISDHSARTEDNESNINVDDRVKVIDGPFASFEGIVQEIHKAANRETKVKIMVSIFSGDAQAVVIPISQVEPV